MRIARIAGLTPICCVTIRRVTRSAAQCCWKQTDPPKPRLCTGKISSAIENGWALFGLMQALKAQGKNEEASLVEARFKKAWARADVTLSALKF